MVQHAGVESPAFITLSLFFTIYQPVVFCDVHTVGGWALGPQPVVVPTLLVCFSRCVVKAGSHKTKLAGIYECSYTENNPPDWNTWTVPENGIWVQ